MDHLIPSFHKLGLTTFEAKAYLALLEGGNVTGYELSKQSGIPSSKVYSVINSLLKKDLLIPLESHPVRYLPRPAADAIEKCSSDLKATAVYLKKHLKKIEHRSNPEQITAKNIVGKKEIFRKARQLIRETRRTLYLALWREEWSHIRTALRKARSKGTRIFAVAYGPIPIDIGEIYQHAPSDPVFRERQERRFVLVSDDEKALFAGLSQEGPEKAVWTENRGLVTLVRDFIIHEIYIVKIREAFPKEMARAFGLNWEKIRIQGPPSSRTKKRRPNTSLATPRRRPRDHNGSVDHQGS
jgi:HTH-type transcriptional regulator, sugar sensing transcriptional regulator